MPYMLDGEKVAPVAMVERLNELGGLHGVGRIDHIEDRLVGIKSREIYESPAAVILHTAHGALEAMTLSKQQIKLKKAIATEYAELIHNGLWFRRITRTSPPTSRARSGTSRDDSRQTATGTGDCGGPAGGGIPVRPRARYL
jgi:argininosuccinate synthase